MKLQQVVGIGLLVAVVALTIREMPEIVRYLKMKSM